MAKHKNKNSQVKAIWLTVLGLTVLAALVTVLLRGRDVALFNPKGLIAQQQLNLIILSVLLILVIAVPTLIILYGFAWAYRDTNDKAAYDPEARHGKLFVFSIWAVPTIFMLLLTMVMWPATHRLQPRKAIDPQTKPLTIQVVAMRWKWLFIYPEQNIASVNYVQVPVGTPVEFQLTADEAPMSSFWIPHLGGQLYAMTGHVNRLNLVAGETGDYPGSTPEINGKGFTGMKFTARASSTEDFDAWVENVRSSTETLDAAAYEKLVSPSENNKPAFYASAERDLYAKLLTKYMGPQDPQQAKHGGGEH